MIPQPSYAQAGSVYYICLLRDDLLLHQGKETIQTSSHEHRNAQKGPVSAEQLKAPTSILYVPKQFKFNLLQWCTGGGQPNITIGVVDSATEHTSESLIRFVGSNPSWNSIETFSQRRQRHSGVKSALWIFHVNKQKWCLYWVFSTKTHYVNPWGLTRVLSAFPSS